MPNKIICFDTETGGLNPFKSALCSVSFKVVGQEMVKTIYIKPQPSLEYNFKAMEINGLTKEFLAKNGVSEKDAVKQITEHIKTTCGFRPEPLGHNIIFDIQFLNALFNRNDCDMFSELLYYHPIDTMILMKGLKQSNMINIQKVNLRECYRYFFNEEYGDAHTSDADVIATEKVYLKILEFLETLAPSE